MRKLKLQVQMSIDGFISGPEGEMDWMVMDWSTDIQHYVSELTESIDTILLGRNLAAGFIPHWADVAADKNNPEKAVGETYTELRKIVFSSSLIESNWKNTEVERGNFVTRIEALKQEAGKKDMIVYGGGQFVSSLVREHLIDEFHLFLNPAILGKGLPIFRESPSMQKLQLIDTKQFECGIVLLVYKLK
jgi:dihydrofolate reductase